MKSLFLKPAPTIYNEVRHDGKTMNFRPWVRSLLFAAEAVAGVAAFVGFSYWVLSIPSPM